jgi:heterodisulfide reductase subunit C
VQISIAVVCICGLHNQHIPLVADRDESFIIELSVRNEFKNAYSAVAVSTDQFTLHYLTDCKSRACYMMDITPRQIVAMFRAGYLEEILHSRAIWICASCYACRVRCPSGILVTDMMYALKRIGISRNIYPPGFPAYSLSRSFISNIYKYGRNFEMGLAIKYLLSSAPTKLLSSASFGLAMIRRGRISMKPTTIKKVNEVRAIIDRARQLEAEGA